MDVIVAVRVVSRRSISLVRVDTESGMVWVMTKTLEAWMRVTTGGR